MIQHLQRLPADGVFDGVFYGGWWLYDRTETCLCVRCVVCRLRKVVIGSEGRARARAGPLRPLADCQSRHVIAARRVVGGPDVRAAGHWPRAGRAGRVVVFAQARMWGRATSDELK